eukprot:525403_1
MAAKHETKFDDINFSLNAKGYIEFNENLVIDSRYKLQQEIVLDPELGTTAKGRYGSVFRVKDLKDGKIKALKINRIPPEEEDAKRQAAKEQLKKQQTRDNGYAKQPVEQRYQRRKVKTVKERYKSSCKREIGVLKRVSRKNEKELIPCLVLYDYGEYLGHTYMIFPIYDLPLQQHLSNVQKYQEEVQKTNKNGHNTNPPNVAPNNALIHPLDLWAFEEQLISALSYIHNVCNVMHLDFKPKNIMINTYGYDIIKYAKNLHLIKLKKNAITLIDFSVSAKAPKKANLDEVRYTGNFGTRRYRPPEMIYGGKWNRSVDTYGTAMIVLECIKLYPIIDTTYYKKKKVMKYKKRLKRLQAQSGDKKIKLDPSYKQLDISEVLYLIIQQIGFPTVEYWEGISHNERELFPQYPLIENIARKGRKAKLFDNDGSDNLNKLHTNHKVRNKKKRRKYAEDESEDTTTSSEEEEDEEWDLFSEKLKAHRGTAWNLFKYYGSNLIETCRLDRMEASLKRMVLWDPRLRITPEQVLKEYFPKNTTHSNDTYYNDEIDDED